ncbi:MAG: glycosyltransferase [Ginsengibacter sp.]
MKVSICCITYNQEEFISFALDGFLMQKTDFEFDIVIGEDCSTDNTLKIIKSYQEKYPGKIKLHANFSNKGMMNNFSQTLKACNGEYIALCEGDDYWVDENKLQKQVDFLEVNTDYSICFHRVYSLEKDKRPVLSNLNSSLKQETYSIQDLARGNFIHTPSVVFRNGLITKMPEWFKDSPVGDYVIYLLNAKYGLIKYLPEAMAVYRISTGIWSGQKREVMAKAWLKVVTLLLQEDFGMETNVIIKDHWRNCANAYLNFFFPLDMPGFIEELQALAKVDEAILYDWAFNQYPNFIKNMLGSKSYKIGKKISTIGNKMRFNH